MDQFPKDPDEIEDCKVDWSVRLDPGDTIASSSWLPMPDGLTKVSDTKDDTSATIWLSGGTDGTDYEITNRVVTTAGRTFDWTIRILCYQQ